jgi:glycerol-3-phosphate acyltransferase PlsY
MTWRLAWLAGGYLAGTVPWTYLVARLRGGRSALRDADPWAGEGDAHVLIKERLGGGWAAVAAALDVSKGFAYPLAARHLGGLPDAWVAAIGVAVVLGHTFPFYARRTAGRGLAAAAGVFLGLLPVTLAGFVLRRTGPASTVGFGSVPVVALVQGQPAPYVAMGTAVFAIILIRRLEGLGRAVRASGAHWPAAVVRRALTDADTPAPAEGAAQEGEPHAPEAPAG